MTDSEIIDKLKVALTVAKQVRLAQKEYFRTRDKTALIESKRLEAALDLRIIELENLKLL